MKDKTVVVNSKKVVKATGIKYTIHSYLKYIIQKLERKTKGVSDNILVSRKYNISLVTDYIYHTRVL